jgi:hypothetical protein
VDILFFIFLSSFFVAETAGLDLRFLHFRYISPNPVENWNIVNCSLSYNANVAEGYIPPENAAMIGL